MTTMSEQALGRQDIEALLPWHAVGTLSRRDAQRIDAELSRDEELARQFALVREELVETIHLNETLGAPSARAMERLLAGIEAEGSVSRKSRFNLSAWIAEQVSVFSPRTLALSATAAALVIALQAGILAGLYINQRAAQSHFQTASYQTPVEIAGGAFALIGFVPDATARDISRFLEGQKLSVVDGPLPGEIYKVRVGGTGLPKQDLAKIVKQIQDETKVVRFAAPTE